MTGATMIMRGEHVPPAMLSLAGATRHIAAERLRALAISSASRWPTLPDLPTFAELGYPDVVYLNCQGVFVAAGTSPEIVARLQGTSLRCSPKAQGKPRRALVRWPNRSEFILTPTLRAVRVCTPLTMTVP